MAAVASFKVLFSSGSHQRLVVYGIYGATSAQTVETSSEFASVLAVNTLWVPSTGTSVTAVCTVSASTLVAISPASITKDDGWLIVMGAGVQQ